MLRAGRGGRGQKAPPRGPSSMQKAASSLVQRGGGANATSGAATERTKWLLLIDALKKKCTPQSAILPATQRTCVGC